MPILTQPSFGPKLSIGFITGGILLDVWALVWRFTLAAPELTAREKFWFYGFLLTGLTFVGIGMLLGEIGRAARKAELPPTSETVRAEENVQTAPAYPAVLTPAGEPAASRPAPPSPVSPALPRPT